MLVSPLPALLHLARTAFRGHTQRSSFTSNHADMALHICRTAQSAYGTLTRALPSKHTQVRRLQTSTTASMVRQRHNSVHDPVMCRSRLRCPRRVRVQRQQQVRASISYRAWAVQSLACTCCGAVLLGSHHRVSVCRFASCGGDRQIFLWDVATGRTIRKLAGHDGVVNSVCTVSSMVAGVTSIITDCVADVAVEQLCTLCNADRLHCVSVYYTNSATSS